MDLIRIHDLKTHFHLDKGVLSRLFRRSPRVVHAVDGVSLSIKKGRTFGLVGESGCGKSTLGRSIFRLVKPQEGEILFYGDDILSFDARQMKTFRKKAQIIFQDPYSCLNPSMTAGEIIAEPLELYKTGQGNVVEKVLETLSAVQLPSDAVFKFPNEFSGGQARRIGVARAIALEPELIVADEPTSGLDISTVATILNLMQALQDRYKLTYLWISHNLDQIRYMCDDMAVMYLGKIVETGSTQDVMKHQAHPYTQALLASTPRMGTGRQKKKPALGGELPSPINPPAGCRFRTRCKFVLPVCAKEEPILSVVGEGHKAACHLLNNP